MFALPVLVLPLTAILLGGYLAMGLFRAVKLAQFVLMRRHYGFAPILLLDDVFDKLDAGRVEFLLKTVASEDFGQIFITDCNKVRLKNIVDDLDVDSAMFSVVSGVFSKD